MTKTENTPVELLRTILSNLNTPQTLNDHPWAFAFQTNVETEAGKKLVEVTVDVFRRMIPPSPPRVGKRMDTRWGAFGILAAQYFAPYLLGTPAPSSLRDAWDSLDNAILLLVFGKTEGISKEKELPYRFAGSELQPAPNSTLGDWHRRGLEQLAELIIIEQTRIHSKDKTSLMKGSTIKKIGFTFLLLLLLAIGTLGWKGYKLYQHVQVVQQKVQALQAHLSPKPSLEQLPKIAREVHNLRGEIDTLQIETAPYMWLAKYGGWIPTYGGTLQQADDLLVYAQSLTAAADDGLSAISPAIETALQNDKPVEILDLLLQLKDSSPKLLSAQIALAQAQTARKSIDTELLLPQIQKVITKQIDPLLNSISGAFPMEDALAMVSIAPDLLGGGKSGPQTYLILIQNEDELRPTGGFLTAVGLAVIKDGKILSIKIKSSDELDDYSKPYPLPPWQFEQFMNIELFALRDSNWFTDFPTTVTWVEYFYSYAQGSSSDGAITLDMHVIEEILKILGPVRVDSVSTPITSENVRDYLRSAEENPPKGVNKNNWSRKQFIADLAQPILEKILSARGKTWSELAPVLLKLLDEKHVLLQFDNPEMTALLERRNWDGTLRIPKDSDFLMMVDTNMGYNKTNAKTEMVLAYSIDLTNIKQPAATLNVLQTNHVSLEVPCTPYAAGKFSIQENTPGKIPEKVYEINGCHWGYLRAYLPQGTKLTNSNPQEIPDTATWLGQTIPARTDDLKDEDIPNAQVFGMMVLTPTQQSTNTEFEYILPAHVISVDETNELYTYRLKIQKQPGTLANALTFNLLLPKEYKIINTNIPLTENAGEWTAKMDLRKDMWIEIQFR